MPRSTHLSPVACRKKQFRSLSRAFLLLLVLAAVSGSLLLDAQPASGQIPPEIPLIQRLGVGARAMGMAGAYSAVAEDYTALTYNPAGLAQIRRVEVGGTFDHRKQTQEIGYLGQKESTPLNKSSIQSLGFAYPFPTYRGSLVLAFSYDRFTPLDVDYFRTGRGSFVSFEEESIQEDGSLNAWQVGIATEVSGNLSLGATATILTGDSRRDRSFEYHGRSRPSGPLGQGTEVGPRPPPRPAAPPERPGAVDTRADGRETDNDTDRELTISTTEMDISAFTGTLGALYSPAAGLRIGLALHLPEQINLDGSATEDVRRYQDLGGGKIDTLDYVDDYDFEDDVDLPFRISTGISYAPRGALRNLLISFDATYADWQQIDYAGPIRMKNRRYAYKPTTDLRIGAEYAFPNTPLRVRAGILSQPLAYRPIATDVFIGDYQDEARLDSDRRYFTLGAGILIDRSLTLDVAFVTGNYERSGRSDAGLTTEKVKDQRVFVGAAFRL